MKALLLTLLIPILHAGTFQNWANDEFEPEEMTNAEISGPQADPDKDGMANLLEYALGTDPLHADAVEARPQMIFKNGQIHLEFKKDTSKEDVTLVLQRSSDLKTWTAVPSELISSKKGVEKHLVKLPVKRGAYFRLHTSR